MERHVRVQVGEGYDIFVAPGAMDGLAHRLSPWRGRRAVVVADTRTAALFSARAQAALAQAGIDSTLTVVPCGETSKSHAQLLALYDAFLDARLTRRDIVLALGGGVVGDLAGFAAASYQRGVTLMQVPTTLLAQVDSSVGGKVAVNLPRGKNLVGAFYQPALVVADTDALATLDARQWGAGLGEVIKYGCIADAALFAQIEAAGGREGLTDALPEIVARCCAIKADYVQRDPLDTGARMALNFGHTLGHALENALGYGALLHGEAVCVGMVAAARFGERLGVTPYGTARRIEALLRAYNLPVAAPDAPREAVAAALALDKKAEGAQVCLVLLRQMGQAVIQPVAREALDALIEEGYACAR